MNAQVRALTSKNVDVRAMATAVNMYQIDHNSPPFRRPGWPCGLCDESELDATYNIAGITSPVAYMSTIPFDPFIELPGVKPADNRGDGLPVGWYLYVANSQKASLDTFHGRWWIWGWGPDKTRQGYPSPIRCLQRTALLGDIIASDKQGFLREDLSLSGQGSGESETHTLPGW